MEIIEVGCPRSIDLISIPSIKEKYLDANKVLQTIDVYDFITIKRDIKLSTGIKIISNEELSNEFKNTINMIISLFSNYVGMFIKDLIVEINWDSNQYLKNEESIFAGLFIALNQFLRTGLTTHELIYLSERVNPLIAYYIVGGYKKILDNGKNYNIGDNPFNKYLLLDKFNLENKEELERLKKFFLNYKELSIGIDNFYFIGIRNLINSSIPIALKREFPKTLIRTINNVNKHKTLIKYLK